MNLRFNMKEKIWPNIILENISFFQSRKDSHFMRKIILINLEIVFDNPMIVYEPDLLLPSHSTSGCITYGNSCAHTLRLRHWNVPK